MPLITDCREAKVFKNIKRRGFSLRPHFPLQQTREEHALQGQYRLPQVECSTWIPRQMARRSLDLRLWCPAIGRDKPYDGNFILFAHNTRPQILCTLTDNATMLGFQ